MNKNFLILLVVGAYLVPESVFAVPALSLSVPKPAAVTYSKASKTVIPQGKDAVLINVALTAGNCTAPQVASLMLGKTKDKNTTSYVIKKPCDKKADFTHTVEASPQDLLPATAARNIIPSCTGRGAQGGLVQIPMDAVLYASDSSVLAKATVNIPFQVTCE